jgi:hypothetical protein
MSPRVSAPPFPDLISDPWLALTNAPDSFREVFVIYSVAFRLKRRQFLLDPITIFNKRESVDNLYCVFLSRSLHFTTDAPLITSQNETYMSRLFALT